MCSSENATCRCAWRRCTRVGGADHAAWDGSGQGWAGRVSGGAYRDGQAWASSHVVCATAQHITKASTGEGTAAHVVQPSATLQGGLVTQHTFGCVEKLLDDHHGGPLRVHLWLREGPRARVGEALQVITHGGGDDEGAGDEQRGWRLRRRGQTCRANFDLRGVVKTGDIQVRRWCCLSVNRSVSSTEQALLTPVGPS